MASNTDIATFVKAVCAGDLSTVRSMATSDPGIVNATDSTCFGATPLIHAVNNDDRPMVDLLLDLGAPIDQRSDWWAGSFGVLDAASDALSAHLLERVATLTAHAAARLGMIGALRDMLEADPATVYARGGDGQTPLHFARTPEIADLLFAHGANIDATDIDHGSTPAQWLSGSHPDVTAHLVERGARVDPFLAARMADVDLLARLLDDEPAGVGVRVTRDRFSVPPPAAGHIYLYTIGEGCTLLHAVAGSESQSKDSGRVVRWLVERGADVNVRGGYDDATPLHTAAWKDGVDAAEALLDLGADLNLPSGRLHHNEPLGWAIVSGAARVVRLLLSRGAVPKPSHVEVARAGARGQFRWANRNRPIEDWQQIERLVGAA